MSKTRQRRRREHPGEAIRSDTVCGFQPSPAQLKYLNALEEALTQRLAHSDSAICAAIGISRMTLWKWRQVPEFIAWLRDRINRTSDWHWPLILHRHELQALQGSVKSAEFIAKVRFGAYSRGRGAGGFVDVDPSTKYTVNYLVHGPDDVASSVLLPLDDPRLTRDS